MAGAHAGEVIEGGQAGPADTVPGLERVAQAVWEPGDNKNGVRASDTAPASGLSIKSMDDYLGKLLAEPVGAITIAKGNKDITSGETLHASFDKKGELKTATLKCNNGELNVEKDGDSLSVLKTSSQGSGWGLLEKYSKFELTLSKSSAGSYAELTAKGINNNDHKELQVWKRCKL